MEFIVNKQLFQINCFILCYKLLIIRNTWLKM